MIFTPHRILLTSVASTYIIAAQHSSAQKLIQPFSLLFFVYAFIAFALSCFAGICSGLTIGYMAIASSQMQLMANSQNQHQSKVGKTILQILSDHHLLLSTLLLSNALALQALPIFLDKIVPSYLAVIISTAAVVVFGQVLPQSYCTGPSKVTIGYFFAPFTKMLEFVLYPIVKPIAWVLDNWLGHHNDKITFTKQNLKALLLLHNKKQYGYRPQQIQMLQNTLQMRFITVKQCMIPLDKVYMLEQKTIIDLKSVQDMQKVNYSKVPVYRNSRTNVIGYIKVKNLLKYNIQQKKTIKDGNMITQSVKLNTNDTLLNAIDNLRNKKINFATVMGSDGQCKGIITLTQIFEKITLKTFNDNDIRTGFNWNRTDKIIQVQQGRQQD